MYIPSYQIHNVFDVYRKQLSRGPGAPKAKHSAPTPMQDRIHISSEGQRQTIMERISSEIVNRIAQEGPEARFGSVLADELTRTMEKDTETGPDGQVDFSYTLIDQDNRRITNTLPVNKLSPPASMAAESDRLFEEDQDTLEEE